MDKRFSGKVALVTGAKSGIGRETALQFAREGARVALSGRREPQGRVVVSEIEAAGGQALFVRTDVTDAESVRRMVDATVARFGRLDCAFNNAGIGGDTMKPTADHSQANWDNVIATNLTGVWLSMKFEIAAMLQYGGGSIVNNSSGYGFVGSSVGHAPYAAAKHGVIGLTRSAAIEYATQGIRVNAVCPGWTHSEMVDPALAAMPEAFTAILTNDVPMQRIAAAAEIARAVLWLCSDEASYVTGHPLVVDGGALAR
jgi:NAD(P)-dependent dehydrogenase (short-subunit alcohol dehydrogenase family)